MCLSYILGKREFKKYYAKIEKHPRFSSIYIGWKIVRLINKGNKIEPYYYPQGKLFPIAKWIDEQDYRMDDDLSIYVSRNVRYKRGFHIFLSLEAVFDILKPHTPPYCARDTKIIKVYYKEVLVYGVQNRKPVVVVKNMYIPKQIPYTIKGNLGKKILK